jgi:hypothetical protein
VKDPTVRAWLIATAIALVVQPAVAAKQPAAVAGTWEISWPGRQGPRTVVLRFEQDGEKLSGSIGGRGRGAAGSQIKGSVKGNKISFKIEMRTQRGDVTLTFRGKVEGDAMSGEVAVGQMTARWTGRRIR